LRAAVIILDAAPHTPTHQIQMFLTRRGMTANMIRTGDITQIDLPHSTQSGLVHALRVLKDVKGISCVQFDKTDIVRHHLVQRIVDAYEKYNEANRESSSTINDKKTT
ncbi:MAG: PhoH family protein, partial [Candidatus Limisoma sp.]|nr:PhoH family protein [Bacteroidales bacterium]MDY5893822.1 PhoH family protein [Candidatus Limisoma sp.]